MKWAYSVFFIEHRGHGFSDRADCIHEWDRVYVKDYGEYVQDMHEFMEQVVKKHSLTHKYYLYAHSMAVPLEPCFWKNTRRSLRGQYCPAQCT